MSLYCIILTQFHYQVNPAVLFIIHEDFLWNHYDWLFGYISFFHDQFQVEKNVFVIFYSGERAKNKILKICEAFGANRYPFSEDFGKQDQMLKEVRTMDFILLLFFTPFFPRLQ